MFLKTDVCTIVVLVLVFGQCSGAAFDAGCATHADCTDPNTECAGSKKCACVAGFTKISSGCKAGLGTNCTATTDCDTTTTAAAVCDVLATPPVCTIQSSGNCSGKTDKCVSNAVCTSNVCLCATKYKVNAPDKLCATVLGQTCSTIAECNTVAYSDCTSSKCNCNTGYTIVGADCKAELGSVCTATSDCHLVTRTLAVCELNGTNKICSVGSGGDCSGPKSTKCVKNSTCTGNVCTCDTGYAATAEKLCSSAGDSGGDSGAEGLIKLMSFALTLTSVFAVKIF